MKETEYKKLHNIAKAVYESFKKDDGYLRGKPLCYCLEAVTKSPELKDEFYDELISLFFEDPSYDIWIGRRLPDEEAKQVREIACLLMIEMTK